MILQVGGEIEFTYTAPNGDTVTVELFPPNIRAWDLCRPGS